MLGVGQLRRGALPRLTTHNTSPGAPLPIPAVLLVLAGARTHLSHASSSGQLQSVDWQTTHTWHQIPFATTATVLEPRLPSGADPHRSASPTHHSCQVYDTPNSHVTRDYQEARGQLGDLHFRVSDTSGLEPREAAQWGAGGWSPAALQVRATALTARLLQQSHVALFVVDAKWVRACGLGWGNELCTNAVMSWCDGTGQVTYVCPRWAWRTCLLPWNAPFTVRRLVGLLPQASPA